MADRDTTGLRALPADRLAVGDVLALPRNAGTASVTAVRIENDDFGVAALVVATLADGRRISIAAGSVIYVESAEAELEASAVAADEGSPEALVARIAQTYPGNAALQEIAGRLAKGINLKAGSNLQDLHQFATALLVDEGDTAAALSIADLLAAQPFDGNFGRWKWIEGGLAIAAYLTRHDDDRSAAYSAAILAADAAETDPLRAKTAALYRQRQLNEPNVYDPEILRASAAGQHDVERDWRVLRIGVLLYLRAHGGSETLSREVLERRIAAELAAVSALDAQLEQS
ncbi:hypothetical protein E8P82_10900 [Arthrobacter echini]|uniref:Uncharacterized protein n=1 Tax=Arthrobacter echini TaxID=1529066 RepID=A0A4S5E348_9MICC|nr:DUF6707 family protein [Arthrobacter echini]THJ65790.1 hypothetical protein E8P82_10900 [Arthrobacter echini]